MFFSDLSGQVSAKLFNPIITAVVVAIPQDVARLVRTRVRRRLPTKWKSGGLAGLRTCVDLLVNHRLRCAVSQLHVGNEAKWADYFNAGEVFRRTALEKVSEPLHYLQPELVLRMELLMRPGAHLLGSLRRARHRDTSEKYLVDIEIVTDTDLRTQDTEEHFRLAMLQWPTISRVQHILGLHPTVRDARCETEQAEPLLMLPDYLAGIYQHADPRTHLGQPSSARPRRPSL